MRRQMEELSREREMVKKHEEEMRNAVLEEQQLVCLRGRGRGRVMGGGGRRREKGEEGGRGRGRDEGGGGGCVSLWICNNILLDVETIKATTKRIGSTTTTRV